MRPAPPEQGRRPGGSLPHRRHRGRHRSRQEPLHNVSGRARKCCRRWSLPGALTSTEGWKIRTRLRARGNGWLGVGTRKQEKWKTTSGRKRGREGGRGWYMSALWSSEALNINNPLVRKIRQRVLMPLPPPPGSLFHIKIEGARSHAAKKGKTCGGKLGLPPGRWLKISIH